MNKGISRLVCKVEPQDTNSSDKSSGSFAQYLHLPNIILLGDPGSGKTYTFKAAAKKENGDFLSVRQFLATQGKGCKRKTLYLDGLDEFRSRLDNKNFIIEVIKSLNQLNQQRFRLSCRIADWLGETDMSLFRTYFGSNPYVVLILEPLSEEEIVLILRERGVEDAEKFVENVKDRGLDRLLSNPQTLIMLSDIVEDGAWPDNKCELYDKSVIKLLSEHNPERMKNGLGQYGSTELMDPAGAVCASLLISGVAGIGLLSHQLSDDIVTYRETPYEDLEKVLACLTRRVFTGIDQVPEAVSYIHRTIAEFLAAKWLTKQIRSGFSLRRVQSLMGIEGYPAPELRGLHAWLATLLEELSPDLINNDPYGVLIYGDSASLSLSNRQLLLEALEKLATTDPWFRAGDWSDRPLGGLSGVDMVASFRRILLAPDSSFYLKSVVLDAVRNGPSLPQLRDELTGLLADSRVSNHVRSSALDALLRVVPDGTQEVVRVFKSSLIDDPSSVRLRSEIVARIYTNHFCPADVVSILKDILNDTDEQYVGEIIDIAHSLPEEALPEILDGMCDMMIGRDFERRPNEHEIEFAFSRMLGRVLKSNIPKGIETLWRWLKTLHFFHRRGHGDKENDIRTWLSENQSVVLGMFKIALEEVEEEDNTGWRLLYDFQGAIMHSVPHEILARSAFEMLTSRKVVTHKECFLYRICGELILFGDPPVIDLFEDFFLFADCCEQLQEIRKELCQCQIQDWRQKDNIRRLERERNREHGRAKNIAYLEQRKESIRVGENLNALTFLVRIFFGFFHDVDKTLPSVERLNKEVGEDLCLIGLEGFRAVLRKSDLPSPVDVALLAAKNKHYPWWYIVLAGMDESWKDKQRLDRFSDTVLKSALAISVELHTLEKTGNRCEQTKRQWKECLFRERPDLVRSVYEDMARIGLSRKVHCSVLYSLCHDEQTKLWRADLASSLLHDFPTARQEDLRNLVLATISDPESRGGLLELAKALILSRNRVKKEQRAIWLIIGYLLDPTFFQSRLKNYADSHGWALWIIKEVVESVQNSTSSRPIELTPDQLQFVIKLIGKKFANVRYPSGGWTGNRNPWDAGEFVLGKINELSSNAEASATNVLKGLLADNELISYHDYLKHAISTQATLRRAAEYKQPSWSQATEALRGGRPANMPDLHALILDHLEALKIEIRRSNTDTYKVFWRSNSRGIVERPAHEDICRDRLIELLRPRLSHFDLRIEPEGHMAADKRADIVILPPPGQKLPLELKRDTHPDLWKACESQLERLYARDPEAAGYGIFVVFWFGNKRGRNLPKPPKGIVSPESSQHLETALRSLIPTDKRHCIEAIVIDVTPPASPRRCKKES